jgi:ABC-type proline/glycine betaine transport system permease subunit
MATEKVLAVLFLLLCGLSLEAAPALIYLFVFFLPVYHGFFGVHFLHCRRAVI